MTPINGAGGWDHPVVPYEPGVTHPIRPVERRNTSPFGTIRRPGQLSPAETRRAQKEAAKKLRAVDERRAGKRRSNNPDGRPATWNVTEAVRRYEAGESAPTIAADMGVGIKLVYYHLKRQGVAMRSRATYGRAPTLDVPAMLADAATMTQDALAKKYGVHSRTIRVHLGRAGIKAADGRTQKVPSGPIVDAARAGMSTTEIAAHLGISEVTVRRKLRAEGVQARDGRRTA